jgi:hypothetical protein
MGGKPVIFVGAVCVTIGWLLASTLAPPVARVQSLPRDGVARTEAVTDPQFTAELRLRQRALPPAPELRRNPFVFAPTRRDAVEREAVPRDAETPRVAAAPLMTGPAYVLSGIGITGDTRTAILTTGTDVHLVRVNDTLGGYAVTEISEDSVTLTRGADRFTLRLPQ